MAASFTPSRSTDAATCDNGDRPALRSSLPVIDYDLDATLSSGQAFRWTFRDQGWDGVVGKHWVRLRREPLAIVAERVKPAADWNWLREYLQSDLDLNRVLATFPDDEPMRAAVAACRGLRLLRQEPWECLASFILSSTKQIVQIQEIVALLCQRLGDPISAAPSSAPAYAFPAAERLARATEADLRACKMGFRAPYLLATSRLVADGRPDLDGLRHLPLEEARAGLMRLPGVGRKIADCVLLFAYGFESAFPVDVWVMKALQRLYFPKRRASARRLREFSETYFRPNAGYAQQYLYHYMRTKHDENARSVRYSGRLRHPETAQPR